MSKKKGLDFFQQKTVPLLCMSHNLFANFLRGSALLSSSAKDGKKESTKGTQKERRSQQNNTSFLSYPSRRITNSSKSFFCFSFCLARYTRLWWLDKKCSCSFDSEVWYKKWIFAPKKLNFSKALFRGGRLFSLLSNVIAFLARRSLWWS